jgi:3-isopropylmalate/(R)-2-methylmalate dehydratase small subunit
MAQFTSLTSRVVALPVNDIDTDQIIPARFLKATDKMGMGDNLFADWRYRGDGSPKPEFVLNQAGGGLPDPAGRRQFRLWLLARARALGADRVWFRAVISTSFADIFRNNALKNGLLPIIVDAPTHQALLALAGENPGVELTLDLASQTLSFPGGSVTFPIDPFNKTCLLNGVDELGYILGFEKEIAAFEARR